MKLVLAGSATLTEGCFVDVYSGQPATGTQPLQSAQFHKATPTLPFTLDPSLPYTLVVRSTAGAFTLRTS